MDNHKLDRVAKQTAKILYDADLTDYQKLQAISALTEEVYEDGYDQAAHDITMKIQSCIPGDTKTVEAARIKGAWQDAAQISLNHLGKLSRTQE